MLLVYLLIALALVLFIVVERLPTSRLAPTVEQPTLATIRANVQSMYGATPVAQPGVNSLSLPRDLTLPSPYKPTPCKCEPDPAATPVLASSRATLDNYVNRLYDWQDFRIWNPIDPGAQVDMALANMLNASADAGALAGSMNPQGLVERMTRWHVPVCIVARRLAPGLLKPSTLAWLEAMAQEHRNAFVARENNLRAWTVLDMASTGLLTRNTQMVNEASQAWDDISTSVLSDTGPIASEQKRRSKSNDYHEYFAQAFVTSGFLLGKTSPRVPTLVNYVLTLGPKPLPWLYLYDKMYGSGAIKNVAIYNTMLANVRASPKTRTRLGGEIVFFT